MNLWWHAQKAGNSRPRDARTGQPASRKLAYEAYEPEAFGPALTKTEAEQRIGVLQAKLKLMSEPPHTQ